MTMALLANVSELPGENYMVSSWSHSLHPHHDLAEQEESNPSIGMKIRQPGLPLCFNDFHIQYDKFSWDRPAAKGTCLTLLRLRSS